MNLSVKGGSVGNKKLRSEAALNPNAAEFVPFSLRSQAESIRIQETSSKFSTSGKSILDRSESLASNNSSSEEEAQQYWRHQLPDDITPDFKVMDNEINSLPFSNLSFNEVHGASRYTFPTNRGLTLKEPQAFALHSVDGKSHDEKSYGEHFRGSLTKPWDKQIGSGDHLTRERNLFNGNSSQTFLADMSNEQLLLENTDMRSLDFLAAQFPEFAAETIAEVYFSNGGNLNLAIKRLAQIEIQIDGGLNLTLSPKAFSTTNHGALNLPSLPFKSFSSIPSRGSTDFTSATRKTASQRSSMWKYDRNRSLDARQVLASSYNSGPAKSIYANAYSRNREEARDHGCVPSSYIEQVRQAYASGNKTLAKELSIPGQLHNLQMKSTYGKAQESIYRQRNSDIQTNQREQMIDLHGLNMSEAIFVLKRELAVLRNAARSLDQRLLVYIFVGLGHHTIESGTPARLPAAVQCCLLEEGLDYSEPQPGLLQVMVY